MDFSSFSDLKPKKFEVTWRSPSNIAFIKYWGKKGHQLPANPSLSMTLSECTTQTKTIFSPDENLSVDVFLDGKKQEQFSSKIVQYLESLSLVIPWITRLRITVETSNTFPHGTGIASSASGMSAFCLGFTDYLYFLASMEKDAHFFQRASFLSRLASGSACRSVYGGFCTWGESEIIGSSDEYASPFEVHSDFESLRDFVLVIHGEEKKVSSTRGHGMMKDHFYAKARFSQAQENFTFMTGALKSGDFEKVGEILESEALALHGMMMTSSSPYLLLKPNTLAAIEVIHTFRHETNLPLYFSLDAGPNLHLIFPESFERKIKTFITRDLSSFAQRIIEDKMGGGPVRC